MLTTMLLAVMGGGELHAGAIVLSVAAQVAFGLLGGVLVAYVTVKALRTFKLHTEGFDTALVFGMALLGPFRSRINQQIFLSAAGLRGAASIVFAIMAVTHPAIIRYDVFHIVFFIVLFSILIQGTLLYAGDILVIKEDFAIASAPSKANGMRLAGKKD